MWLSFFEANEDKPNGLLIYEKQIIHAPFLPQPTSTSSERPRLDSAITISASNQYEAGSLKRALLGSNYRNVWKGPVTVPVFDIDQEKGGFTIIKRGGGMQTKSLRLQAKDGKEYVLRSVDKDPAAAIPNALRGTLAADVVQDQISASHPYGALATAHLSNVAGIYSTHPKMVYVPDDARLLKAFAEKQKPLALFVMRQH